MSRMARKGRTKAVVNWDRVKEWKEGHGVGGGLRV